MSDNPGKLLKEAERCYRQGEKKKGALLVERVLMDNFNHAGAWQLLYKVYGGGKPFGAFQREFSQTYYPDKIVLLNQEEATRAPVGILAHFGRLFKPAPAAQASAPTSPPPEPPQEDLLAKTLLSAPTTPVERSAPPFQPGPSPFVEPIKPPPPASIPTSVAPFSGNGASFGKGREALIRVLVVDDITLTRDNIIRSLTFEQNIEVVGNANSGTQAIEMVRQLRPDVVLMDINMPGMDGIAATRAVIHEVPYAQVIILSVQDDTDYLRKAMMAGARDFLTKPPMIDELIGAVLRAGEIAHRERLKAPQSVPSTGHSGSIPVFSPAHPQGKIITVYSPKGGAGCTLIAANLAVALHNDDSRVALVDGNLQFGDLLVLFNEQSKNTVLDLAPRAAELDADIVEEVMVAHKSGIHLLAPPGPQDAEQITGGQFAAMLDYLRNLYAYVIVDTPARLSDVTIAALDTSDLVLLLTTQDIPAIANLRKFMDLVPLLKFDRRRIITVMNQYNQRINIDPVKVGQTLQNDIIATLPCDARLVIPSINRGIPFMLESDSSSSELGKSIRGLAETVRQRSQELRQIPAALAAD